MDTPDAVSLFLGNIDWRERVWEDSFGIEMVLGLNMDRESRLWFGRIFERGREVTRNDGREATWG